MANWLTGSYAWIWRKEKLLYVWSWRTAQAIFRPTRADYRDRLGGSGKGYSLISNAYIMRGAVGYLIWAVLRLLGLLAPGSNQESLNSLIYVAAPFWMVALMTIIVSAVLYMIANHASKRRTARSLWMPVSRALLFLVLIAVYIAVMLLGSSSSSSGTSSVSYTYGPVGNVLAWMLTVISIFLLPLLIVASFWLAFTFVNLSIQCYFYNFRSIDGHPYLGPFATVGSVWAVVIYDALFSGPSLSVRHDEKLWLRLSTNWGGPVILTVLAAIEIVWIWRNVSGPEEGSIALPGGPALGI